MRQQSKLLKSKSEKVLEALQLPQDIVRGEIRITITGNREAWVENYKGLLEYSNNTILLQAKNCKVQIEGKALNIDFYTNEDMKITGRIISMKYL